MTPKEPINNGGRVTTREFYELQLQMKDEAADRERLILSTIKNGIDGLYEKIDENQVTAEDRINALEIITAVHEDRLNGQKMWDTILGAATVVGATIAGIIGSQK